MAIALAKRGVISDETVVTATEQDIEAMAKGLGCAAASVPIMVGGE
jgi:hypothetical protein